MKPYLLLASMLALAVVQMPAVAQEEPLRIFIRSGPKSHGPGAHDHPRFLKEWVPMLNARGARATGAEAFPTREQLAETDVLVLHAQEAGNIDPPDRRNLEEFLARGGGVVVIHAAAVSRDPDWYKQIVGGSWRHGTTRWLEGPMHLYFTDRESPITKDISNWAMDDEIYYDMDMQPDVRVLAAAYTPKPAGARNPGFERRAYELTGGGKRVSVFDVQPQIWTYERTVERGRTPYRAMVSLPGHLYVNFDRPAYRALLLRGMAWAGRRTNVDMLLREDEIGAGLRYVDDGPVHPAKAAGTIEIHPEFDLTLVAAEPLVSKVMSIDWDERGRMWVAETPEYPNGRRAPNVEPWKETGSLRPTRIDRDPEDTVSILTDTSGDGVLDHRHVFADKLELVTGFVLYRNGVIAAAAPDIWYLEDTTGDQVADTRTKLYTGLGTFDTHAVINNLRWGLDGWIYATHGYSTGTVTTPDGSKSFGRIGSGVVRFKPDGSAFEQYSSRGGNTWGLDITWDGQVFWTQPTSGTVLFHTLLPEYVLARGRVPGTTSWKGMITGQNTYPLMTWPEQAYVQIDQVGQFTAAAGCVIYDGGAWPERWRHSYFTTEPTINIVHHQFVEPEGVSYTTRREPGRERTEFMRSRDMWFRPIETRVGPDGALYIVDFYNQAVIHNDTRGPHHGPANAAVRPDRDHYFARIWRVQHKEARRLEAPALDRQDLAGLIRAMETSPNAHVRQTAWRLAQENHAGDARLAQISRPMGSRALELYERARMAKTPADRLAMLDTFAGAADDWTRSAIVAAAADDPIGYLEQAFGHPRAASLDAFVAAVVPAALPDGAGRLLVFASGAPAGAATLKPIVTGAVARMEKGAIALDPATTKALESLLADPATDAAAVAIVARWDTGGVLRSRADDRAAALAAELTRAATPDERRVEIAESLLPVPTQRAAVLAAIEGMLAADSTPDALKARLMTTLGSTSGSDVDRAMVGALARTSSPLLFDHILKRPAAALALVAAMNEGQITPAMLGPGNVARLRTHPNRDVARQASALLDKLVPQAQKSDVIASLLPHIEGPGNAERGRNLFVGACGACHRIGEVGTGTIGPPLNGMGAHGRSELLTAIIDPNREVDPSFWQWNITTTAGQTLAGVIVSESSAGVTLRTEGGDVVLKKEEIASRENTRRSLMPEGLEALGSDVLRDILAFMEEGDARFRIVDLRQAFTADSRRGLRREEDRDETVTLHRFGDVTVSGVPFFVMDPARSTTGLNFIALKSGPPRGNALDDLPSRVEIPTSATAASLHILGGVGGWAWPHGGDEARGTPVMRIVVHFADGTSEEHVLRNGEHVADFDAHVDVPGSTRAGDFTRRGQLRYVAIDLKKAGTLSKIVLESMDPTVIPATVAITASAEPARAQPQPGGLQRGSEQSGSSQRGALAPRSSHSDQSAQPASTAPPSASATPQSVTSAAGRPGDNAPRGVGATVSQATGTTARVDVPGLHPSAGDRPSAAQEAAGPREGGKGDAPLPETKPIAWGAGKTKVLLIAGGSAHDFGRHFGETDGATLRKAGFSVHYTEDRDQAVEALREADVAVISVNRQYFDTPAYRKAVMDFAAAGKGLVMLHPGTWYAYPDWPELNAQIVGGGARGHDRIGRFSVNVLKPEHPVMRGVPASFEVEDELYYVNPDPDKVPPGTAKIEVLAETSPSVKFKQPHPSVWVTAHPTARIVNIALGHDERVHEHAAFRTLLVNAVRWAGRMN